MLRSIVEGSGTHVFAIIGLVLFVLAFAGAIAIALLRKQSEIDKQARLPLDDDPNMVQDPRGAEQQS